MFELKLKENTIYLKWGTWAMREYCKEYNISLEEYFASLADSQKDIDKIVKIFFIGYKSACNIKKEDIIYTENDVCNWIDEIGGIFNPNSQLVDYFKYILSTINLDITDVKKDDKKKVSKV